MNANRRFAVDVDSLEWKPAADVWDDNANEGVWIKILRENPATGEYVALVRLLPGAAASLAEHRCAREQFLIEGSLTEAGVERLAPAYWCISDGERSGTTHTRSGATVLLICDGNREEKTIDEESRS